MEQPQSAQLKGFHFLGMASGIKAHGMKDFAVLSSQHLCTAAGVFTKNKIKGAPLSVTQEHLSNGKAQAIVVNSGCANVATGQNGISNAKRTAALAAHALGIAPDDVLVASTGVIGKQLPMEKIEKAITAIKERKINAAFSPDSNTFAEAIMTTDTVKKIAVQTAGNATLLGIAKGSGMIAPNMATMLAFLLTDAEIPSEKLQEMLRKSVNKSFNMVTVDMDTSTSDMALLLANGTAGKVDEAAFQLALDNVCIALAKKIAQDGEGATKLVVADIHGARDMADAKQIAKAIVSSPLVKCALYGKDPNWGRILCAIGNSNAQVVEQKICVWINDQPIVEAGSAAPHFDEGALRRVFAGNEIVIRVHMGIGAGAAQAYGCDMTEHYVRINAAYMT